MPIDRNTAQYITGNPQQPTQSSAPGIWDIDEQGSAQAAGRWPLPPNVVQRSLRFDGAAWLNRTPSVAPTSSQRLVYSTWVKRAKVAEVAGSYEHFALSAAVSGASRDAIRFRESVTDARQAIQIYFDESPGGVLVTSAVYRDPSAWYHVVVAIDTTQAAATNPVTEACRVKIYVNGVLQTELSTATYPAQNYNFLGFNASGKAQEIGRHTAATFYFNGYIAETYCIDGYPTGVTSGNWATTNIATLFGQTDAQTGQWIPRVYSGSYGTNGYRLQFLDNSGTTATTLGKDTSGMGNNWTPNNFSVAAGSGNDSLRDVPMNYYSPDNGLGGEVIGNYATLNPNGLGGGTLSNGNLDLSSTVTTPAVGTMAMTTGKWYWEITLNSVGSPRIGVFNIAAANPTNLGGTAAGWCLLNSPSRTYTNGVATNYGSFSPSAGAIVNVAYDADAGKLWFGQNGVWFDSGSPSTGGSPSLSSVTGTIVPALANGTVGTDTFSCNFGQRPFAYTAPSGFKALCTQNFSAPRIGNVAVAQANDYFNATLYTGNGASSNSITGVGFQPDFVWVKSRTNSSGFHILSDAVRGAGRWLSSNSTGAEGGPGEFITSFDSDGFSVNLTPNNTVNENGGSYVSWNWNAGGSTVTNTSGSITSSVRASQTAGFSVVTYTGTSANATVGHGLGVAPSMVICKSRGTSGTNWGVWHISLTSYAYYLLLNTTAGQATAANAMQALPSSTLLSLGASSIFNDSAAMVAYCFAAVPGFSAFGSYTGNGSTDGPFVYTGFRPRWVLIKISTGTPAADWVLHDTSRSPYNVSNIKLSPNTTTGDVTSSAVNIDILSSGFKIRNTDGAYNTSTNTYIYAAFAEIPFQFANAR